MFLSVELYVCFHFSSITSDPTVVIQAKPPCAPMWISCRVCLGHRRLTFKIFLISLPPGKWTHDLSASFLQSLPDAWGRPSGFLSREGWQGVSHCVNLWFCDCWRVWASFCGLVSVLNLSATASVAVDCLARVKDFPWGPTLMLFPHCCSTHDSVGSFPGFLSANPHSVPTSMVRIFPTT